MPIPKRPAQKVVKPKVPKKLMPKGNLPAGANIQGFYCSILGARALSDLQATPSSMTAVTLSDQAGSFADWEFIAVSEAKREMLAVALAAISTQSTVFAIVDVPTGAGPIQCYSLGIVAS